jgi:hypothetical protein
VTTGQLENYLKRDIKLSSSRAGLPDRRTVADRRWGLGSFEVVLLDGGDDDSLLSEDILEGYLDKSDSDLDGGGFTLSLIRSLSDLKCFMCFDVKPIKSLPRPRKLLQRLTLLSTPRRVMLMALDRMKVGSAISV